MFIVIRPSHESRKTWLIVLVYGFLLADTIKTGINIIIYKDDSRSLHNMPWLIPYCIFLINAPSFSHCKNQCFNLPMAFGGTKHLPAGFGVYFKPRDSKFSCHPGVKGPVAGHRRSLMKVTLSLFGMRDCVTLLTGHYCVNRNNITDILGHGTFTSDTNRPDSLIISLLSGTWRTYLFITTLPRTRNMILV